MIVAAHVSGVNAAFPLILRQLGTDVAVGQWILTVYTLALSGSLLTFGSLGDQIGLRAVYVMGMWVYGCGSGGCALASKPAALVLLRGVEGIGAAMISATSVAMLAAQTPRATLGRALGWQCGMTYVGLTLGPVLGAVLVQFFGWRALFLINAPAALAAIAIMPGMHQDANARNDRTSFVSLSNLAWIATLVSLTAAFSRGGHQAVSLVMAAVSGCLFIWTNSRSRRPLLPFRAFRATGFLAAAAETVYYGCLHASGFLIPLYLTRVRGFSAVEAGIFLATQGVARAAAAPFSGRLLDRSSTCRLTAAGVVLSSVALCVMCGFTRETPAFGIAGALVLLGGGTGIFVPANSNALLSAAPSELYGAAAGILATARNIGMTFGVAAAALLYTEFAPGSGSAGAVAGVRPEFAVIVAFALTSLVLVAAARRLTRPPITSYGE